MTLIATVGIDQDVLEVRAQLLHELADIVEAWQPTFDHLVGPLAWFHAGTYLRAPRLMRSVALLLRAGLAPETDPLTRVLCELAITAGWIRVDPTRAEIWSSDGQNDERKFLLGMASTHDASDPPAERLRLMALAAERPRTDDMLNVCDRALHARFPSFDASKRGIREMYEHAYRRQSGIIHSARRAHMAIVNNTDPELDDVRSFEAVYASALIVDVLGESLASPDLHFAAISVMRRNEAADLPAPADASG